jgi:hypothetical protein
MRTIKSFLEKKHVEKSPSAGKDRPVSGVAGKGFRPDFVASRVLNSGKAVVENGGVEAIVTGRD